MRADRVRVVQRVLTGLLVALVAVALYPLMVSERTSADPRRVAPASHDLFGPLGGCPQSRDGQRYSGLCVPPAADAGVRLILSHDQQLTLFHRAPSVVDAVNAASTVCIPSGHGGSPVQGGAECSLRSQLPTPAAVLVSLGRAGFPRAEVRIAGPGDPAPVGSILYAVHLGDGCLVGYQGVDAGSWITGPLLDGRCLGDRPL